MRILLAAIAALSAVVLVIGGYASADVAMMLAGASVGLLVSEAVIALRKERARRQQTSDCARETLLLAVGEIFATAEDPPPDTILLPDTPANRAAAEFFAAWHAERSGEGSN